MLRYYVHKIVYCWIILHFPISFIMDPDEIDLLLEAKSTELRDLQNKKVQSLTDEIRLLESQLKDVRLQYNELKDSFQYNLDLLGDRDKELVTFESCK